jgi:hypothetical protein
MGIFSVTNVFLTLNESLRKSVIYEMIHSGMTAQEEFAEAVKARITRSLHYARFRLIQIIH